MRFFSKLVFLCNICFIVSMVMRFLEGSAAHKGNPDSIIKLQPIENTLIILGYSAIFLNFIFVLLALYWFLKKKINRLPRPILVINILIFVLQVWYFFYTN
jgi:hypothetical protein